MTDYTKNLIGKADQGLGKAITQGKNLFGAIGAKVKKAGEIMRKGPVVASATGIKTPEKQPKQSFKPYS